MMKLSREIIRQRLQELAKRDRQRRVFGSASHDDALTPPRDVAEIEAFESKHKIALPEDDRYFITQIGDGGAGPAYGMFPFGFDDEATSRNAFWGLPISHRG
jgi:hypothetical protein